MTDLILAGITGQVAVRRQQVLDFIDNGLMISPGRKYYQDLVDLSGEVKNLLGLVEGDHKYAESLGVGHHGRQILDGIYKLRPNGRTYHSQGDLFALGDNLYTVPEAQVVGLQISRVDQSLSPAAGRIGFKETALLQLNAVDLLV